MSISMMKSAFAVSSFAVVEAIQLGGAVKPADDDILDGINIVEEKATLIAIAAEKRKKLQEDVAHYTNVIKVFEKKQKEDAKAAAKNPGVINNHIDNRQESRAASLWQAGGHRVMTQIRVEKAINAFQEGSKHVDGIAGEVRNFYVLLLQKSNEASGTMKCNTDKKSENKVEMNKFVSAAQQCFDDVFAKIKDAVEKNSADEVVVRSVFDFYMTHQADLTDHATCDDLQMISNDARNNLALFESERALLLMTHKAAEEEFDRAAEEAAAHHKKTMGELNISGTKKVQLNKELFEKFIEVVGEKNNQIMVKEGAVGGNKFRELNADLKDITLSELYLAHYVVQKVEIDSKTCKDSVTICLGQLSGEQVAVLHMNVESSLTEKIKNRLSAKLSSNAEQEVASSIMHTHRAGKFLFGARGIKDILGKFEFGQITADPADFAAGLVAPILQKWAATGVASGMKAGFRKATGHGKKQAMVDTIYKEAMSMKNNISDADRATSSKPTVGDQDENDNKEDNQAGVDDAVMAQYEALFAQTLRLKEAKRELEANEDREVAMQPMIDSIAATMGVLTRLVLHGCTKMAFLSSPLNPLMAWLTPLLIPGVGPAAPLVAWALVTLMSMVIAKAFLALISATFALVKSYFPGTEEAGKKLTGAKLAFAEKTAGYEEMIENFSVVDATQEAIIAGATQMKDMTLGAMKGVASRVANTKAGKAVGVAKDKAKKEVISLARISYAKTAAVALASKKAVEAKVEGLGEDVHNKIAEVCDDKCMARAMSIKKVAETQFDGVCEGVTGVFAQRQFSEEKRTKALNRFTLPTPLFEVANTPLRIMRRNARKNNMMTVAAH